MKKTALISLAAFMAACHTAPASLDQLTEVPQDYRMHVSQYCYCPQELLGPFELEVRNGQATKAVRISDGQAIPLDYIGDEIPDLALTLKYIQEADPARTYKREIDWIKEPYIPGKVVLDRAKNISDDEITITIENFELLPSQ